MSHLQFSRPLAKAMALMLCFLCLMAPLGSAAEETGRRAANEASAAEKAAPAQPAASEAQELSQEESSELSARAEEPGPEVVGGALSNTHLTYIVIALAAAVIVLIAK